MCDLEEWCTVEWGWVVAFVDGQGIRDVYSVGNTVRIERKMKMVVHEKHQRDLQKVELLVIAGQRRKKVVGVPD